jgi:hypothetical protein
MLRAEHFKHGSVGVSRAAFFQQSEGRKPVLDRSGREQTLKLPLLSVCKEEDSSDHSVRLLKPSHQILNPCNGLSAFEGSNRWVRRP